MSIARFGRTASGHLQRLPWARELTPPIVTTGAPAISGTAAPGQTLTGVSGAYTPAGWQHVSWQWTQTDANGAIYATGSGATFQVAAGSPSGAVYLTQTIIFGGRVRVAASAPVSIAATTSAPVFTNAPTISGSTALGSVLTAVDAQATGVPAPVVSRQWFRDGVATGQTGASVVASAGGEWQFRNGASNGVSPNAVSAMSNIINVAGGGAVYATVSTLAEMMAAVIAAPGGAIIEVTGGVKYGSYLNTSAVTKSPQVTIRPQNRNSPPIFAGPAGESTRADYAGPIDIRNWSGIRFDGLTFRNTKRDWRNGVGLSDSSEIISGGSWGPYALRLINTKNVTVVDCLFDRWFGSIDVTCDAGNSTDNLDIGYNTFVNSLNDVLRIYQTLNNCRVHHNDIKDSAINLAWQKDTNRHPDWIQMALTSNRYGSNGVVIEDNRCVSTQRNNDYHGVFAFAENIYRSPFYDVSQRAHRNITIRRNLFDGGNTQGIAIGGCRDVTIRDNVLRRNPASSATDFYTPQIHFIRDAAGAVAYMNINCQNNAWDLIPGQTALKFGPGKRTGNTDITGSYPVNVTPSSGNGTNLVASVAYPVGWETFDVARGRVGQYAAR